MAIQDTPVVKYPSQAPPKSDGKNPHVMIAGAGLGGLLLAILLDKAGIPYQLYERAKEVKPFGAIMSLNAGILPTLEQLELFEDLQKLSLPATGKFNIYKSDLTTITTLSASPTEFIGYDHIVFARPDFYDLLLSKIPAENIHFNKKVVSLEQNKEGVMIRCTDGTTYHGDILVGADGAYSGVRQALYMDLEKSGQLPLSDAIELNKGFICMAGTTTSLDPAKYPGVDDKAAQCNQIIGKNNYTWSVFSVPGNRICWNVVLKLSTIKESAEHKCKNSEWDQETSVPTNKDVRDFLIPFNGTLEDLIDATPRDNISRVFLEDKLFDTWHHGRTVLIGDALQDAVVLANCLYGMKGLTPDNINEALGTFRQERFGRVKSQYKSSRTSAQLLYGQVLRLCSAWKP
ncbi:hypothetical protein BGX24_007292 [Mortierella sp. AD032]|nr:hypothetical protein BGX24_007292 [Mortierella sp. AD032]